MEPNTSIARITGWISLAPLITLPVIAWTGAPDWLTRMAVGWGALLLAFWAGSLWTRHVDEHPGRPRLLIASLALALVGWLALILPFHWAMFWLATLFAVYLFIDEPWQSQGRSGWFRRMRLLMEILTVAILIVSGLVRTASGQ